MNLKQALITRVHALGFGRVFVGEARAFDAWREETRRRPHARWQNLVDNPASVLAGARRVVVLVWPYAPYRDADGQAAIDAYYVASNASHQAVGALGEWLTAQGIRAVARPNLPHKAAATDYSLAHYGRNGLSYIDELGSRYALELIVTDAALETDDAPGGARDAFSKCGTCSACVRACPTGALAGDGRVDMTRCLRVLYGAEPLPEPYRTMTGNRLLGCDICQRVCPQNAGIADTDTPAHILEALRLPALLDGQVDALVPLIGTNYARKKRMQAYACLAAANLGRADLLSQIEPLTVDDSELVRAHAQWATEQLRALTPAHRRCRYSSRNR